MIKACITKNKITIIDNDKFANYFEKGYGTKVSKVIVLDINEAAYLLEKDKIKVTDQDSEIDFEKITKRKDFDMNEYVVYRDLRLKGYNIGSGLKYGYPFRLYDKGTKKEDHSMWLVDIFDESDRLNMRTYLAKNRVAHSSKKKMLIAIVDKENQVTYLENTWKRL